jgi:SAM-dependent methyltransferase
VIPGAPAKILSDAHWLAAELPNHGLLLPGQRILDFGCGIGKLAIPLTEQSVEYAGVDVRSDCIAFCRRTFAPWPQFSFQALRVRNAVYARWSPFSPKRLVLPYPDASFDAAVAVSVFTHLETEAVCRRALQEIRRVLRPAGVFFSTWFRSPPNASSSDAGRRVFAEPDILSLLGTGFGVRESWGGTTAAEHDQWCIVSDARSARE